LFATIAFNVSLAQVGKSFKKPGIIAMKNFRRTFAAIKVISFDETEAKNNKWF